jgi:phosphoglycolate/pyridoxal phosphate phosphatase family enzyme
MRQTKSRAQYIEKCAHLGIEAHLHEFFTSSYAAAAYLEQRRFAQKVFIVGEQGIALELESVGIPYVASWDVCGTKLMTREELDVMTVDPDVGAVVVGNDVNFTYPKLAYALRCLLARPDSLLIATNPDSSTPMPNGFLPGAGAIVAAVAAASRRTPLVMGKPEQMLLDMAVERCSLDRARTVMVGDKLDTDIVFGQRGGLKSILVLSGVTSADEAASADIKADYTLASVADLVYL